MRRSWREENPTVNATELTALLHRSESETLDFKSKQYLFALASDPEKSELLKDIVAMANAWKSSDGYILIGVEEENERATGICGADTTLGDSDVQQFVNSKTNRPISFRIEVFHHQNANLTIIHIDKKQRRPIYLLKNFGTLKKEVVYIRRGTSTDEAAPDEVAEMGKESGKVATPDVSLEFEIVIEQWETGKSAFMRYGEPEWMEVDFLKIYAVNHKGGLAQYVQGSIWIPSVIPHGSQSIVTKPEDFEKTERVEIKFNNKISDRPGNMWHPPSTPEWKPLSPGMRVCLEKIRILPYRKILTTSDCPLRWQLAVDDCELVKGEIKFCDIPVVDQRKARHQKRGQS